MRTVSIFFNNFPGANQVLANGSNLIPTKYHFRPLAIALESKQTSQYPNLSAVHRQELESIAFDEEQIGASQARAVLSMVDEVTYDLDIDARNAVLRSRKLLPSSSVESLFSVQPNPAKDHLWLTIPAMSEEFNVRIKLTNLLGQIVFENRIAATSELIEVKITDIETGLYLFEVFLDGKSIGVRKLEIMR